MKIIGEKINGTIPGLKEIIESRDEKEMLRLAILQAESGSDFIDVNVAVDSGGREEEVDAMRWAVSLIKSEVDKPLCIDSPDPEVIKAGLETYGESCMINSAKAEEENLDAMIPMAVEHKASLVALAMDESGIPKTVGGRLEACARIASACGIHGLALEYVYFDPLVLPVGTDITQGMVTIETLQRIKNMYPEAKTTMGLSNVSFGLPERGRLNEAFLHMAICAGLDSAIMDPTNERMTRAVKTAEALVGSDRHCRKYMREFRKK